ncbi:glycosyltransferase family 2 protein [Candidatus Dependentiae bacterium]
MKKLSIIIPCYNEEKNIPFLLERFGFFIKNLPIEVILVDNGSFDESAKVLTELIPKYSFARTVRVEKNQGYGFGILYGLKYATGDFIGWIHADIQTDPSDVARAFDIICSNDFDSNLFIKGLRKKRSIFDTFFTLGMSVFETFYLKERLWDINAQPTIFHKSFFSKWQNPPSDFSLDLYALYMAKKCNLKIRRFEVLFPPRIHGKSSWNTGIGAKLKLINKTISFSADLKKRASI